MLLANLLLTSLAGLPLIQASLKYAPDCCAAERCFEAAKLPAKATPVVSLFCELYIHKTPGTVTQTHTVKTTTHVVPPRSTVHVTTTTTVVVGLKTDCSTVVTTSLSTQANYPTYQPQPNRRDVDRRGAAAAPAAQLATPSQITQGCHTGSLPSQLSSACSCFLTSKTVTATQTSTVTVQEYPLAPTTVTSRVTVPGSTSTICTSTTSTSYSYVGLTCGVPSQTAAGASGSVTCAGPAPAGETVGLLRIEGDSTDGTIFEGCVSSGPEVITTPSGGSHECDGTNDGANPNPGATCTTQLDSAAEANGFPYDGTYDSQFQDYFITSIADTTQTSTEFWGLLQDLAFTAVGGCQQEIQPGGTQETLWAFNAFNVNDFLRIEPGYEVVQVGAQPVQVTVLGSDGGGSVTPFAGATIQGGGTTSDSNGVSYITVPSTPGCYQFKATAANAITSNAFYLTVLPAN